eukprot:6248049-Ditylum_brightwellii.AAC.1
MCAGHWDVLLACVGLGVVPGKCALGSMPLHNQWGTQRESTTVANLQWGGLEQNYKATLSPCAYLWYLDMGFPIFVKFWTAWIAWVAASSGDNVL